MAGLLFGAGLVLAGMVDPGKVLAFLDVAGAWDPSLALTLFAAVGVAMGPHLWMRHRGATVFGDEVPWPSRTAVDSRLLIGSATFGAGWGLTGYCPGPALVAMAGGSVSALVFSVSMLAGFAVFRQAVRPAAD